MRYQILITLNKIVARTLDGRKVMIMPLFLKDAYRTGHCLSEYKNYRFYVEYLGEINSVLMFLITPTKNDTMTVRLLVDELNLAIGSAGKAELIYATRLKKMSAFW